MIKSVNKDIVIFSLEFLFQNRPSAEKRNNLQSTHFKLVKRQNKELIEEGKRIKRKQDSAIEAWLLFPFQYTYHS